MTAPFRRLILLAAAAFLAAGTLAHAQDRVGEQDVKLGNPNAPVTMIEYASVTCPHCAKFNATVMPVIKARYINTGKVLYIYRDFPTSPENVSSAGALIARCSGPQRYLAVIDALFRAQEALFKNQDVHAFFMAGARVGGLNEEQMKACITDGAALAALNARVEHANKVEKVNGTPTVFINGKMVDPGPEELSLSYVEAAIRPLLGPPVHRVRRPIARKALAPGAVAP